MRSDVDTIFFYGLRGEGLKNIFMISSLIKCNFNFNFEFVLVFIPHNKVHSTFVNK